MLTRMRLINFKSWRDSGDLSLAPLTGFFGTNSSGKSSLLQMLLLLKQTAQSRDNNLVLKTTWDSGDYLNLGTLPELVHTGEREIRFEIAWDLTPQSRLQGIKTLTFTTEIAIESPNLHYVQWMQYQDDARLKAFMQREQGDKYKVYLSQGGQEARKGRGRPPTVSPPIKCYGFSPEALLYYLDGSPLNELGYAFESLFSDVFHLGPLREYPQRTYSWAGERPSDVGLRGERAAHALLAGANERVYQRRRVTLEQRIAEWLVTMGLASDFRTERISETPAYYRILVRRSPGAPAVPITDVGFGISQIFPVLVLCYYAPRGSTLILEQPEIHLHPSVQSLLADVFIDVIKQRNMQILLESHSEHLLRRLQRRIAEGELDVKQTALYFCDIDQGVSSIERLQLDLFGRISNWPQDFFGDLTGDVLETYERGLKRELEQVE